MHPTGAAAAITHTNTHTHLLLRVQVQSNSHRHTQHARVQFLGPSPPSWIFLASKFSTVLHSLFGHFSGLLEVPHASGWSPDDRTVMHRIRRAGPSRDRIGHHTFAHRKKEQGQLRLRRRRHTLCCDHRARETSVCCLIERTLKRDWSGVGLAAKRPGGVV